MDFPDYGRRIVITQLKIMIDTDSDIYRDAQRKAESSSTSPEELDSLFKQNIGPMIQYLIAYNPNCLPETLSELACHNDVAVRWRVASNPNTKVETLLFLSKELDPMVVSEVAGHCKCPMETLMQLGKSTHPLILSAVAENPNTDINTIVRLSQGADLIVRALALEHPKYPKNLADWLDVDW